MISTELLSHSELQARLQSLPPAEMPVTPMSNLNLQTPHPRDEGAKPSMNMEIDDASAHILVAEDWDKRLEYVVI